MPRSSQTDQSKWKSNDQTRLLVGMPNQKWNGILHLTTSQQKSNSSTCSMYGATEQWVPVFNLTMVTSNILWPIIKHIKTPINSYQFQKCEILLGMFSAASYNKLCKLINHTSVSLTVNLWVWPDSPITSWASHAYILLVINFNILISFFNSKQCVIKGTVIRVFDIVCSLFEISSLTKNNTACAWVMRLINACQIIIILSYNSGGCMFVRSCTYTDYNSGAKNYKGVIQYAKVISQMTLVVKW